MSISLTGRRMNSPFVSVGPTVQFSEVHRYAALLQLDGPPTPGDVRIHTISLFCVLIYPAFTDLQGDPRICGIRRIRGWISSTIRSYAMGSEGNTSTCRRAAGASSMDASGALQLSRCAAFAFVPRRFVDGPYL